MSQDSIAEALRTLGIEPTCDVLTKVKHAIEQGCSMFSHAVSQALFG